MTDNQSDEFSIGTDIVEIQRFRILDPEAPFFRRVFTESELAYCFNFSDPAPHLAATFAGKEAVIKTIRYSCAPSLKSIEILRNTNGAPYVATHQDSCFSLHVSLSYSSSHAVAVALSVPKSITDQKHIQGLLDGTIQKLLPGESQL